MKQTTIEIDNMASSLLKHCRC